MSKCVQGFPFSAVEGQEYFKLALLLAAINPLVGGVLVSGPRGSAKSTLAKGLADILPIHEGKVHAFVTLPLGASEEMLIGTLNLQRVLNDREVEFQAGLLARAHEGVLYVDEVNLLPDNLVDQLLDVAASGVNIVERDGISHQHPAEFILLGTMNPDEGELRPQLSDRFGLSIVLSNQYALEERIEIVRLRECFDTNPSAFIKKYTERQQALMAKIETAQSLLSKMQCSDDCRRLIAEKCESAKVDGLRADIVWIQAAMAYAALQQRTQLNQGDVLAVEELVLQHRRKVSRDENVKPPPSSKPFSRPDKNNPSQNPQSQNDSSVNSPPVSNFSKGGQSLNGKNQGDWGAMVAEKQPQETQVVSALSFAEVQRSMRDSSHPSVQVVVNRRKGGGTGLRQLGRASRKINWFGTLLANAGAWPLRSLRYLKRKQGEFDIHLVLLDTSASTLDNHAFAKAKGLILQLAEKAYLARDQFALLSFGRGEVETLVSLRRAPKTIEDFLGTIKAGGGTPLKEALLNAAKLQQQQCRKHETVNFKNYIITDGRISDFNFQSRLLGDVVVVDIEQSQVKRGKAKQLAQCLDAQYIPLCV